MPELPEVEIIKRELSSSVSSLSVINTYYSGAKFKRIVPELSFLIGQNIIKIHRRNKYLILELNEYWLVIHLGMTGNLIYSDIDTNQKHVHLKLFLSNGSMVYFQDPRRFGSIDLFSKKEHKTYFSIPLFSKLGIEPLSSDFTLSKFKSIFVGNSNIKKYLMDSEKVCGIGNIYASEILFLNRINPQKRVCDIPKNKIKPLYESIIFVLKRAIELGGSSISDFVHTNGVKGEMQNFYNVYGRSGENCKGCGCKIKKLTQFGRSTFYCEKCQP